jgi:hypothetical protein
MCGPLHLHEVPEIVSQDLAGGEGVGRGSLGSFCIGVVTAVSRSLSTIAA